MPGPRLTRAQKARFFKMIAKPPAGPGYSAAEAAKKLGFSPATAYRLTAGLEPGESPSSLEEKLQNATPDPKAWEELGPEAQELLKDFGLFSEKVLCRDPSPWRIKAAEKTVEMILDKTIKHYMVANTPPGVGKSTLWTLDIPLWLICGGGICDPGRGRALRVMLGHRAMNTAQHYLFILKQILETPRPFLDFDSGKRAEFSVVELFGRFRPDPGLGDPKRMWAAKEFFVAQLGEYDYYKKEPTVQAASREKGFIGERVDYAAWDDLVDPDSTKRIETVEADAKWMELQTERRIEPGGVLWLIGQRLGPNDLFRNRLNKAWEDEEGLEHRRYEHIIFPAHHESTCDGNHRQWDAEPDGDGCLLDEKRLSWREILTVRGDGNFRTVFQQEDSDPQHVLVPLLWLEGGLDLYQIDRPGCWDHERGFWEWPDIDGLVDYAAVDPAAGGWWAIEHWATKGLEFPRYLIVGLRKKMGANGLLDWSNGEQRFTGVMEEWQQRSVDAEHPIRVWVVEKTAQQRWLMQYEHFERWKAKWKVEVIGHETQRNKTDPKLGVEGTLPGLYRDGMKRIPRRRGDLDVLTFTEALKQELTTYPDSATTDCVMADWMGEYRLQTGDVMRLARRSLLSEEQQKSMYKLPPYLERQRREFRP